MDLYLFNFLSLDQSIDSNFKIESVDDTLLLADLIAKNLLPVTIHDYLYLQNSLDHFKTVALTTSDSLSFSQSSLPRQFNETVEQLLFVWSYVTQEEFWPVVEHELELTSLATNFTAKGSYDVLELDHDVEVGAHTAKPVSHSLALVSSVNVYKPTKWWIL